MEQNIYNDVRKYSPVSRGEFLTVSEKRKDRSNLYLRHPYRESPLPEKGNIQNPTLYATVTLETVFKIRTV